MIIAFTRLHYGADYLGYVIRSALPFVDKYVVLYTPTATFGNTPTISCPDPREQLLTIAISAAGNEGHKIDWHDDKRPETGEALAMYPDADMALELDADEVIHPWLFEHILENLRDGNLTKFNYRLPFLHYWRSFRYACEDSSWPARLYLPKNAKDGDPAFYDNAPACIHHFGYARKTADVRYKWECSMHNADFRSEWWEEIWHKFPERLTDLHPVSRDFWNAREVDPTCLPEVLKDHDYSWRGVIE